MVGRGGGWGGGGGGRGVGGGGGLGGGGGRRSWRVTYECLQASECQTSRRIQILKLYSLRERLTLSAAGVHPEMNTDLSAPEA